MRHACGKIGQSVPNLNLGLSIPCEKCDSASLCTDASHDVLQEYQWARSLVIITMHYISPFWSSKLSLKQKFRTVQCCFYYIWQTVYHAMTISMVLLPVLGLPFGPTTCAEVWLHYCLPIVVCSTHFLWVRSQGWLRPQDAPFFSLESSLHQFARLYWISKGVLDAILGYFTSCSFTIAVTPKGQSNVRYMRMTSISPFATVALICTGMTWIGEGKHRHLPFAFGCWNTIAAIAIIALHYYENHARQIPWSNLLKLATPVLLVVALQAWTYHYFWAALYQLTRQTMVVRPLRAPWNDNFCVKILWMVVLSWAMLCSTWNDLVDLKKSLTQMSQAMLRLHSHMMQALFTNPKVEDKTSDSMHMI